MNKNNIKYFLGATLLTTMLFTGCDDGDQIVDQITDNVQRGAVLRTVDLVSNELPIGEADGNFTVDLEVQDIENGGLVQDVEVYVGFRDNTDEFGPGTDVDEALVETISSSTFTIGEFGLPRFTYSVTLPELLSIVGRNESDITGGDQFTIRFELVLSDGRRFSFADNSGTLTGSFFSSPFLYTPLVICPVPEDFFTGDYSVVQTSGSSPFGIGDFLTQSPVTVVATGTNRSFGFTYDPGGFAVGYTMSMDLVCNLITGLSGTINSGSLGCNGGASSIGQTGTADVPYDFAVGDESFSFEINDFDPSADCGAAVPSTFTMTKL